METTERQRSAQARGGCQLAQLPLGQGSQAKLGLAVISRDAPRWGQRSVPAGPEARIHMR